MLENFSRTIKYISFSISPSLTPIKQLAEDSNTIENIFIKILEIVVLDQSRSEE